MRPLLLALVLVVIARVQAQDAGPILTIRFGTCDTTLNARVLSTLPVHSAHVENRDGEKHTYSGPYVIDVLQAGCPGLSRADKRDRVGFVVRATSADGYRAAVALMEADTTFSPAPAILALTMDGRPLDAREGPVKLIVPGDMRHARHVRGVSVLEVVAP
ncbi:MAG: molybdopterin-dependent oxidoreductase [Flavobacteriales bacterium]|nr:molybdopterin-dependent oxidoreductase [Flavobacteriales bacterium]